MELGEKIQERVRSYFKDIGKCIESIEKEVSVCGVNRKFSQAIEGNIKLYKDYLGSKICNEALRCRERCFIDESNDSGGIPNFVSFLGMNGEVSITKDKYGVRSFDSEDILSYRFGIFLNGNYLGYVDFKDSEVSYFGKIPEFENEIRMVYVYGNSGSEGRREDGWKIPFP